MSWIVSKAALVDDNHTVVTHDTTAGRMAALRFDSRRGFRTRWSRPLSSLDFSALTGDPAHRQIVIADRRDAGESVVWLDERTRAQRDALRRPRTREHRDARVRRPLLLPVGARSVVGAPSAVGAAGAR